MERNPKLDLKKTNVPVTWVLGKQFSKGSTEYGDWYGYNAEFEGKPHTVFADAELHELLSKCKTGDTVITIWEEKKNPNTGKKYYEWKVNGAIFDHEGNEPAPGHDLLTDKEYRDSRITDWKNLTHLSLAAAKEVCEIYNDNCKDEMLKLGHEDVRALAISQMIDWQRRG